MPDVKMLIKIADYYNVTLDELVREEYDLSTIKEYQVNTEIEKVESKINIEQYIGKICDVSMNSFRYSVIRNVEIVGIDNDMVCFIKNKKYGYFNIKKTLGILIKKEALESLNLNRNNKIITGKCMLYANKGTYFGGITYYLSEIREIKQESIIVSTGKFESEISLDEVSVIFMKKKIE